MTVDKAVSLLSQMFLIQFSKEEHEALAMAIDALNVDRKTESQKSCFTCGYSPQTPSCDTCEGYSNWWSLEDEPQTSGVVWTEDAIKNEPKSYTTWASTDEPQTKQQTKRPWGMYIIEHPMYE